MAESRAAVVAALLSNGDLAAVKGISAATTGSAAMLAEMFHSDRRHRQPGAPCSSSWEAIRHYLHPIEKEASLLAYGTPAAGFVSESISLGVAVHALARARGDRSIAEYWRESRDPTLITSARGRGCALLA